MQNLANSRARQQPSSRPGAYMGLPGEALQRSTTLRFSLVGASAVGNPEPLVQMEDTDHHDSSTLLQPEDEFPTSSEWNLAVANQISVTFNTPSTLLHANPINVREQKEKQERIRNQQKTFGFILVLLVLAAAAIIAWYCGGNQKEQRQCIKLYF